MGSPAQAALIETWTLYGFGTLFIALRVYSRTKLVGVAGYRPDDYLIFIAWAAYTVMTIAAHIVGGVGDTSHLTMEERLAMTPHQRSQRSLGSKFFMVGWYTYITLIWTLKFNMLCLYQRVVSGVWVEKFIKPTMALVITSAIAIYILFAVGCQPFHRLWQVLPDPGPYCCPQSPAFLITVLVLNLVTDICIILIPAPVIIPLKTTMSRKLGLILLFSGGAFIMIAAILRVYYVLAQQQGQTAAIWSCREDVIAILVGQATMIKPLFSRRFWGIDPGTKASSRGYERKYDKGSDGTGHELSDSSRPSRMGFNRKVKDPYSVSVLDTRSESEERIVDDERPKAGTIDQTKGHGLSQNPSDDTGRRSHEHTISVQRTIDVESVTDPGYAPDQKPNYGHNSRIHSKWQPF